MMGGVEIVVHTIGGALGLDRVVEVAEGKVTVTERGEARTAALAPDERARIDRAAARLATVSPDAIAPLEDVVDAGRSEIAIASGGARTALVVPAGAEAPDAVWDLLEVVDELADGS